MQPSPLLRLHHKVPHEHGLDQSFVFALPATTRLPFHGTYNLRTRGTQITVAAHRVVQRRLSRGLRMRTGSGHLSSKVMYCRFYAFMQFLRFRQHEKANAGTAKRCVKRAIVGYSVCVCVCAVRVCGSIATMTTTTTTTKSLNDSGKSKRQQKPALNCTNCNLILRFAWPTDTTYNNSN